MCEVWEGWSGKLMGTWRYQVGEWNGKRRFYTRSGARQKVHTANANQRYGMVIWQHQQKSWKTFRSSMQPVVARVG